MARLSIEHPMTIYFSSDEHYFHKKIVEYTNRPFKDVEEMNAGLIKNHNEVVGNLDTVIHVGDFSMDSRKVKDILSQLNGEHYLVMGNHDRCHPVTKEKKRVPVFDYIEAGFKNVTDSIVIDDILVHHMPYSMDDRHGERYSEYRPKDEGKWLIHGHVHQLWGIRGRQINVGVDVRNYRPIDLETIKEIIAQD